MCLQKQYGDINPIRGSAVRAQALFKDLPVGIDLVDSGTLTPELDWKKFDHSKLR